MTLRLPEHWLWDFWFAVDGDDVHVFHLQAPRSLVDPEERHRNATIGHAVSRDGRSWRVLGTAMEAGPAGAFDDMATWTGSVLRHDGRWHLFYTGISHAQDGAVQRIGLAVSDDLVTWERRGVLLEADPRWYEREHWRDPWVTWDEERGRFDMLITARANDGPHEVRGVIAHAWSEDLRTWEAGPPLSQPGSFYELEVPQLVHLGGAWRILFCTARGERIGTHYLTATDRLGPYILDREDFLLPDRHYAGRLLEHRGELQCFAWLMRDEAGAFGGELSDPMPVTVRGDGSLHVEVDRAGDRTPAS
jgi:beta-fructofuranosidase